MKLPARAALIGSLSLLLAACAAKPIEVSMQAARNADYGRYPKDYQQHIRGYLDENLRDAGSAKIRITTPPRKVLRLSNQGVQGSGRAGWDAFYLACADVNAKNAYGGYTGWQTHRYRFHKGGLVEDEKNLSVYDPDFGGTDFAACTSRDEIFIDTESVGNVQVNIVP